MTAPAATGGPVPVVPSILTNLGWAAALALAAALGALDAYLAYVAGPELAAALPIGAAIAVAVFLRPVLGACMAVLSIPLERIGLSLGAAGLSPMELLLVLTAGAVLARAVLGASLWPPPPMQLAAGLALAVMLSGLLVAEDSAAVLKAVVMWAVFVIVSLWVSRTTPRDLELLLLSIVFTGGVLGALAVSGGASQELLRGGAAATGRATATFAQPNLLGFYLTLAVPPAVVLALHLQGWRRAVAAACAVLATTGLVLTLSRGSILGTTCALVVLFVLWPPFRRFVGGALVLVAVLAALNFNAIASSKQVDVVSQRLGTIANSTERGSDPRFEIWSVAPQIFTDHPLLGVGYGNFPVVSPRYGLLDVDREPYEHAHDLLLTVLAEGGLIGTGALVLFCYVLVVAALRALRDRGSPHWPLALAVSAALLGLFVVGITDFPLGSNAISATALLEAAVLVGLARMARESAAEAVAHPAGEPQGG